MSSGYSSTSEPEPKGQPHSGPSLNLIVEATIPGCRMVVRSPLTGTQAGGHRAGPPFKKQRLGRRLPTFR
jgi:hypothetical protein